MKKLLPLLLICAVLSLAAPVSADYYYYKDVSAVDYANALVDYYNAYRARPTDTLCGHNISIYYRTSKDFTIQAGGYYYWFPIPVSLIPLRDPYTFAGILHVNNPREALKKPCYVHVYDNDTKFTAIGDNWRLEMWDTGNTRFYY